METGSSGYVDEVEDGDEEGREGDSGRGCVQRSEADVELRDHGDGRGRHGERPRRRVEKAVSQPQKRERRFSYEGIT